MAGELKRDGVAVNALWPRTTIATAAVGNLLGGDAMMRASRTPEIMGDAAYAIFTKPSREFTGHFCIDDKVLYADGVRDFEPYRVDPKVALMSDFFVPDDDVAPPGRDSDAAAVGFGSDETLRPSCEEHLRRSNPESREKELDYFVAELLAMTETINREEHRCRHDATFCLLPLPPE